MGPVPVQFVEVAAVLGPPERASQRNCSIQDHSTHTAGCTMNAAWWTMEEKGRGARSDCDIWAHYSLAAPCRCLLLPACPRSACCCAPEQARVVGCRRIILSSSLMQLWVYWRRPNELDLSMWKSPVSPQHSAASRCWAIAPSPGGPENGSCGCVETGAAAAAFSCPAHARVCPSASADGCGGTGGRMQWAQQHRLATDPFPAGRSVQT